MYTCFSATKYGESLSPQYACSGATNEVTTDVAAPTGTTAALPADCTTADCTDEIVVTATAPSSQGSAVSVLGYAVQCRVGTVTSCDQSGSWVDAATATDLASGKTVTGLDPNTVYTCFSATKYGTSGSPQYACSDPAANEVTTDIAAPAASAQLGSNPAVEIAVTVTPDADMGDAIAVTYAVQCRVGTTTACDDTPNASTWTPVNLSTDNPKLLTGLQPNTGYACYSAAVYTDASNNVQYVCSAVSTATTDVAWEDVGTAGFSAGATFYTSLALASNDVPYVAYRDAANGSKATVMKYDGSGWVPVGSAGFSAGTASFTSLALDSNDVPYVAYKDGANGNKATVMKYDSGSGWVPVGSAGFSAGGAAYTSLALDSNNVPYVAYRDLANGDKATVMKY